MQLCFKCERLDALVRAMAVPSSTSQQRSSSCRLIRSIWSRLFFVCVAVSETLERLRYEQHGLSAPVRKRPTQRAGDVPCVPYAAASRADKSCTFYKQTHRRDQRRQLPVPLQFLPARDQVPYAMGIYPEDNCPEAKTHNQVKYTYAPYIVVPRPAKIVKCCSSGLPAREYFRSVSRRTKKLFARTLTLWRRNSRVSSDLDIFAIRE
jgi:hypothetical protein